MRSATYRVNMNRHIFEFPASTSCCSLDWSILSTNGIFISGEGILLSACFSMVLVVIFLFSFYLCILPSVCVQSNNDCDSTRFSLDENKLFVSNLKNLITYFPEAFMLG